MIDPDKRELAVYLLREDAGRPARLVAENETFTSTLLPGLEISLGKILAH